MEVVVLTHKGGQRSDGSVSVRAGFLLLAVGFRRAERARYWESVLTPAVVYRDLQIFPKYRHSGE